MQDSSRFVARPIASRGLLANPRAREPVELCPRTWYVQAFGNSCAIETDDGLILVDTSSRQAAPAVHEQIRSVSQAPLHTVVYTHGHVDHAFGMGPWLEEAQERGTARPRVIGHRNVLRRFAEYDRMRGLNEHINKIQFGAAIVQWPREFHRPDTVYDERLTISLAGEPFELRHAYGETDDATYLWAPERKLLCTGDLWISCAPNCGNPQKVQRYAEGWTDALREMAGLGAEILSPGHGPPMLGADEIRTALLDVAAWLESIIEQTLAGLNAGMTHEQIVASVRIPPELSDKPYLAVIYDRPEFIVRNLIRLHGGWWDGEPANLMPAATATQAREIASLAGGVGALVDRARALADEDLQLACHLASWAAAADPADVAANECVRDLFSRRAESESSLMGRGILMHAVRRAEERLS